MDNGGVSQHEAEQIYRQSCEQALNKMHGDVLALAAALRGTIALCEDLGRTTPILHSGQSILRQARAALRDVE